MNDEQDRQDEQELVDPQDTAELSDDMAPPPVKQQEIRAWSVYDGLVAIARTRGKLYRTHGRRSDMMRFDLTARSVFVGGTFIVSCGKLKMPVLETAAAKVDLTGLPWLTDHERTLDPKELFLEHYMSRPDGSEKFMASNFPAKDIDELSDDEVAGGLPRVETRVRLEAWILCAALDGTLERYVKSQPNWTDGDWWWSPPDERGEDAKLVIKTDWWKRAPVELPRLVPKGDVRMVMDAGGAVMASIPGSVSDADARAMQVAPRLVRLAKSLAQQAFRLQMHAKTYDIDPAICEVNRIIEYVDTGRLHNQ